MIILIVNNLEIWNAVIKIPVISSYSISNYGIFDFIPLGLICFRNTILTLTEPVILFIHESESGGREGPWKTVNYPPPLPSLPLLDTHSPFQIALSEQFFLRANELNDLPALFSTEFEFEIIQRLKIELWVSGEEWLIINTSDAWGRMTLSCR